MIGSELSLSCQKWVGRPIVRYTNYGELSSDFLSSYSPEVPYSSRGTVIELLGMTFVMIRIDSQACREGLVWRTSSWVRRRRTEEQRPSSAFIL